MASLDFSQKKEKKGLNPLLNIDLPMLKVGQASIYNLSVKSINYWFCWWWSWTKHYNH